MPELPEVETVRRGLAAVMAGRRFAAVELRRPDLRFDFPDGFARRLTGAVVRELERRGKYLLAPLSTGETLLMHLGMSGRFTATKGARATPRTARHDHVVFRMAGRGGATITFNDPRRFGFMDIVGDPVASRHLRGMGPEPLGPEFSPAALEVSLRERKTSIKAALLDQHVVAGLGNIYASEALFRAAISPKRAASSIRAARAFALHGAIIDVLNEAIAAGGSSLKDFASAEGRAGDFQHGFKAYGRAGQACPRCAAPILRFVQGGRATFYCKSCQK